MGLLIDEAPLNKYFQKQPCAKARELVVLKWAMMGFLLTTSYKGILLSKLINIEYEKSLDSVDDVLRSNKPVVLDSESAIAHLVKSDPREKMKAMSQRIKPYQAEKGAPPMWVIKG